MGVKITGGSAGVLGFGVRWDWSAGDEAIARAVVIFLEDRRLLFGERHLEDEWACVQSANLSRVFLTDQIIASKPGKALEEVLKAMRAAFRQFVDRGGHDAVEYRHHHGMGVDRFSIALGDLRSAVGHQLMRIAWRYELEIDEELAKILPPTDSGDDDVTVVPGFEAD